MAYAAVSSLMGTIDLHFLQSQPRFPLEDLESHIRYANENIGLLQAILEDMAMKDAADEMREMKLDEACSSKGCTKRRLHEAVKKQSDYHRNELIKSAVSSSQNAWDRISLTSRLSEVDEVKQKMASLHENLGSLQESLEKSEIGNDDAGAMKDLEAEMRDVLFKAEERIEVELSTIYLGKGWKKGLRMMACLLRLHELFNEAKKQTDYLKDELIRIKSSSSSEYQVLAKAKASSSQTETITDDVSLLGRIRRRGLLLVKGLSLHDLVHKNIVLSKIFKNASKFDDSRMVGCHDVFKKILDQLTQQSTKKRKVVSIVGMGGIGKTTLACQVYEDPSITSHFYMRAWVTVAQEYKVEQMLQCLIACVTAASRDELHDQCSDQDQLADVLRKCLKDQRYLIVIDDIWSTTAWDRLQRCFPDDNNGSCILLTSRLKEVAKYASSGGGNSIINMPFLDADESWSLYCNVFGKYRFPSKFEEIGRDIVKKCKGLPLAITIVASLLSKTEKDEKKWKNVAKSLTHDSNDACSRILYLSYNQLPHYLKACFLYFGIFEEDYEIPVKELVRLWAAEGFLRAVEDLNLEEVGMKCLQELVDRSLVMVSKQSYKGEMKRIRIHDLLRDLCLKEGGRENLLNVMGDEKLAFIKRKSKPCRWISQLPSGRLNNQIRSERRKWLMLLWLRLW